MMGTQHTSTTKKLQARALIPGDNLVRRAGDGKITIEYVKSVSGYDWTRILVTTSGEGTEFECTLADTDEVEILRR